MIDDVMNTAKEKMQKSCAAYERDMMGLRAGRANPQLLDRILVDYYGTPTPIPQIGNISSPEPRLLVIAPWEAKMIPQVEKAIQKSDLGLNPSNDGKIIRLVFPELNEERRRDLSDHIESLASDLPEHMRRPPHPGRPGFPPEDGEGFPPRPPFPAPPEFSPENGNNDQPRPPRKPKFPGDVRIKC